jgi:hypothetical protein
MCIGDTKSRVVGSKISATTPAVPPVRTVTVKPNMTKEEERRARASFEGVQSQVVNIKILSVDIQALEAVVRVSRRDTINGSIVSSFPQTFRMSKGQGGWSIHEIGR